MTARMSTTSQHKSKTSWKTNQGIGNALKFKCWANPGVFLNYGGFDAFERQSLDEKEPKARLTTVDMSTSHPQEDRMRSAAGNSLPREQYKDPDLEAVFGCRPTSSPMFGRFQTRFTDGLCIDSMQFHIKFARENGTLDRPLMGGRGKNGYRLARSKRKRTLREIAAGETPKIAWDWTESADQTWEKISAFSSRSVNSRTLSPMDKKLINSTASNRDPVVTVDIEPPVQLAGTSVDLLKDRSALASLTRQLRWSSKQVELRHLHRSPPSLGGHRNAASASAPLSSRPLGPPVLLPYPRELCFRQVGAGEHYSIEIKLQNPGLASRVRYRIPNFRTSTAIEEATDDGETQGLLTSFSSKVGADSTDSDGNGNGKGCLVFLEAFPPAGYIAPGVTAKVLVRLRAEYQDLRAAQGAMFDFCDINTRLPVFTETGDLRNGKRVDLTGRFAINVSARVVPKHKAMLPEA